ncbi:uncharacterized protein LOC126740726 [Anthonomus grandis grandis]|uniref:uncharacterized protein LOC126740726 n=1 Tax=Anthonomus grandis grandis TaxID=2921223 RepID=UPI0021662453|nr:uncharacterized protein LOC126740726 [Anthonomus grandis grandis]XP_050302830.1 uncharacterized protein LOC126740726 [Anthonomus grandis grandis]XP_050302832.1 uncharacterized protein LOC126740726 [Anthonomus grandis grandis]
MTTTEHPPTTDLQSPSAESETETKTIFSILSKIKETDLPTDLSNNTTKNDEDILIVTKAPNSNTTSINKSVYLKLHRSDSPSRNTQFDRIKESFEKPVPAPKPRRLKSKSQIFTPTKESKEEKPIRHSWNVPKIKHKDVNSNNLKQEDSSGEDEFVTIVTRSDSEESVLKFEKELSAFTMDKKKRTSSFKKIFSVFSSNKDKKKKHQDKTLSNQNKENGETYSDNFNNESNSFSRQSAYRHTISNDTTRVPNSFTQEQLSKELAQHQINQMKYRENLERASSHLKPEPTNQLSLGYTPMDKPINYKNNVNIHKYIDTSSSASTLESSERSNLYQNEVLRKETDDVQVRYPQNSYRPNRVNDNRRDTPPRLLETQQDVRLVNPKALIPINSERPLPNPYQNGNREQSPINSNSRPHLDDTYGTVFDSLEKPKNKLAEKPPRSPSVEGSKIRLPPNREIIHLSPRIRSPIPPENIPTEKIIATELLKPKRSPTPPTKKNLKPDEPSHQRLEIDIDYPDNLDYMSKEENLVTKPPLANKKLLIERIDQISRSSNESVALKQRLSQASPSSDRLTTSAQIHTNSPSNRTPTPNYSLSSQNLSISPVRSNNRPSTPSNSQISQSPKTTPQKQDMRKSVEAYYWNEIKKLKDQENYELYLMQMQYNNSQYDNANIRRSRSMSPTANRDSRRSLSLPREARPAVFVYPNPIPENRAVTHQAQPRSMQQLQFQQERQHFQHNTPERSTVDGSPRKFDNSSTSSLYRPIFKRGSLSTPPRQTDDSLKRKVSFSGSQDPQPPAWPTRNGFTQSPPQRRDSRQQLQGDDDVFYAQNNEILRASQRNDLPTEEIYYNNRPEPTYVLRGQRNGVYTTVENPYGQRMVQNQRRLMPHAEEALYGQPIDAVPILTRHGSIQIQEELYESRPMRRLSYQNNHIPRPSVPNTPVQMNHPDQYMARRPPSVQSIQHPHMKREIIVNDEIFGQFGGYAGPNNNNIRVAPSQQNIYSSRQSIVDYNSQYISRPHKQVTLSNKVCDMYGQIHDTDSSKIRQSGVIMGQLQQQQQQSPGSPPVARNPYNNQQQFVRNSRLTSSASDMYRRAQQLPRQNEGMYGRVGQNVAPSRPLPPVPNKKLMGTRGMVSDTESGSDASEIQRIMNSNGGKGKKKGLFGK